MHSRLDHWWAVALAHADSNDIPRKPVSIGIRISRALSQLLDLFDVMAFFGENSSNLALGVVIWSLLFGALVLWMLSSFYRKTKQQRESFLVPSCPQNVVYFQLHKCHV
jgi:RsiW-degrading membrane proteinase PrsW (M82 family)